MRMCTGVHTKAQEPVCSSYRGCVLVKANTKERVSLMLSLYDCIMID